MAPRVDQRTPMGPFAVSVKPTVAPTMEWVPDTGSRSAVATISQMAPDISADRQPAAKSFSPPSAYKDTSKMPFRIVSDTLYPVERWALFSFWMISRLLAYAPRCAEHIYSGPRALTSSNRVFY